MDSSAIGFAKLVVLASKVLGSMIGIVFSSEEESRPFLKRYARGRLEGIAEGESIHDDELLVSILGIGKIKATLRIERLLRSHKLERVILAGSCLSLSDDLNQGDIIAVEQVFEGDRVELSAPTYPRMPVAALFRDLKSHRLVTQDHSIIDQKELSYWQRVANISDSTGYAVAYVAGMHGIPCHMVKVVVGSALEQAASLTRTPNHDAFETLAKYVVKVLPKLLAPDS